MKGLQIKNKYCPNYLNFTAIKKITIILLLLLGQQAFAQTSKHKLTADTSFYLYYGVAGLGSNLGSFEPTLRIYDRHFAYTKEQNSYWSERSTKKELICTGRIRQSSVDSILKILQGLKDTTIYKTNPGIMSGSITYVAIAQGRDTVNFTLDNTSDTRIIKIVDIINTYLPKNKKLYESADAIKREEAYWIRLSNEVMKQNNDSIKRKQ
ncbi:hypothetical protein [Ferruginibacter sp. SUN106]|uniref:hypothetical protein n=1 Tax=Ferruginibacter sp. SUN106 TaxID=2978348 RepID=UPI003D36D839